MIIYSTSNQASINGIAVLKHQFPSEVIMSFDEFVALPQSSHIQFFNKPIRLTFLAHTYEGVKEMEGLGTSQQLAITLKTWLQQMEQRYPSIKQNIECVDLLGCETGFVVDENDEAFAATFAKELNSPHQARILIPVKAFTNLSIANPFQFESMRLGCNVSSNTFEVFAYHTKIEEINDKSEMEFRAEARKQGNQFEETLKKLNETILEKENVGEKICLSITQVETEMTALRVQASAIKAEDARLKKEREEAENNISNNIKKIAKHDEELEKIRLRKIEMAHDYAESINIIKNLPRELKDLVGLNASLSRQIYKLSKDKEYLAEDEEEVIRRLQETKREVQSKRLEMTASIEAAFEKEKQLRMEKETILKREKTLNAKKQSLVDENGKQNLIVEQTASLLKRVTFIKEKLEKQFRLLITKLTGLNKGKKTLAEEIAIAKNESAKLTMNLNQCVQKIEASNAKSKSLRTCLLKDIKDVRAALDARTECNFTGQLKSQGYLAKSSRFFEPSARCSANNHVLVNEARRICVN